MANDMTARRDLEERARAIVRSEYGDEGAAKFRLRELERVRGYEIVDVDTGRTARWTLGSKRARRELTSFGVERIVDGGYRGEDALASVPKPVADGMRRLIDDWARYADGEPPRVRVRITDERVALGTIGRMRVWIGLDTGRVLAMRHDSLLDTLLIRLFVVTLVASILPLAMFASDNFAHAFMTFFALALAAVGSRSHVRL